MNQEDFPLLKSLPRSLVELSHKLAAARHAGELLIQAGDQGFASAPSNIALLKYWGKHRNRRQIPVSSSVSRSLDGFRSFTRVAALTRMRELPIDVDSYPRPQHEFRLHTEGVPSSLAPTARPGASAPAAGSAWAVGAKLRDFIDSLLNGWADDIAVSIESRNNFPTGCGVASSASGYAALVGSIADMAGLQNHFTPAELQLWLTEWARIGSGSATRSAVQTSSSPSFVTWEVSAAASPSASAPAALASESLTHTREIQAHKSIRALKHLLVVVSAEHKTISSSEGHLSAENSRFQTIRVAGLAERFEAVVNAIENGQVETLRFLSEEDAFSMHAVMATSTPPITYMTDLTTAIIASFLGERRQRGWQALWTLDAGPNIHFLVAPEIETEVRSFLDKEFGQFIVEILSGDAKLPQQSDLTGLIMGRDRLSGIFNG